MTPNSNSVSRPLAGRIAVVAGATRGAVRGIAWMLGEAGAIVYCTGRSTRDLLATPGRPETIDETAEMVTAVGGQGIAVRVDHTVPEEVQALFERVIAERGHLDILVNDIWGGDALTEWGKPIWELDPSKGFRMLELAVHTHILTSRFALPHMIAANSGLVIEVTDGDHMDYRGNFYYDLAKTSVIRLAYSMWAELRDRAVVALAVTPGFLRSEAVLERLGVSEDNWRDGIASDPNFAASETPAYIGRAVAALAADANVGRKAKGVYASWTLAKEYGFVDLDGRQPDWGAHFAGLVASIIERGGPSSDYERALVWSRWEQLQMALDKHVDIRMLEAALNGVKRS
ncbi:MAG TPA: SDR family oxidoreductase [Steroidobacteraceae bacterium]|nr:SDR family oxidoreductase [Steroidobacteraceae bacterium]